MQRHPRIDHRRRPKVNLNLPRKTALWMSQNYELHVRAWGFNVQRASRVRMSVEFRRRIVYNLTSLQTDYLSLGCGRLTVEVIQSGQSYERNKTLVVVLAGVRPSGRGGLDRRSR